MSLRAKGKCRSQESPFHKPTVKNAIVVRILKDLKQKGYVVFIERFHNGIFELTFSAGPPLFFGHWSVSSHNSQGLKIFLTIVYRKHTM
jgi:hypothetical protein